MAATVIAILSQKGGTGKTTITMNLGISFVRAGARTLLIEMDPQGSLSAWQRFGTEAAHLTILRASDRSLPQMLKENRDQYDVILIDGVPDLTKTQGVCVHLADVVLIPTRPSALDYTSNAQLAEVVKARQITDPAAKLKAAFIVTQTMHSSNVGDEMAEALGELELPVLKTQMMFRVIHYRATFSGQTAYSQQDGPGMQEIESIRAELEGLVYGEAIAA